MLSTPWASGARGALSARHGAWHTPPCQYIAGSTPAVPAPLPAHTSRAAHDGGLIGARGRVHRCPSWWRRASPWWISAIRFRWTAPGSSTLWCVSFSRAPAPPPLRSSPLGQAGICGAMPHSRCPCAARANAPAERAAHPWRCRLGRGRAEARTERRWLSAVGCGWCGDSTCRCLCRTRARTCSRCSTSSCMRAPWAASAAASTPCATSSSSHRYFLSAPTSPNQLTAGQPARACRPSVFWTFGAHGSTTAHTGWGNRLHRPRLMRERGSTFAARRWRPSGARTTSSSSCASRGFGAFVTPGFALMVHA